MSVIVDKKVGRVSVEKKIGEEVLKLETGEMAKQANGAVLARYGDTMVLVTVTASKKPREGVDFLPLTVDYEEKMYAAGKIPGGFYKREGKPTEKCILTCRLIDRPLRPLFPKGYRNDVQIIALVFSADPQVNPDVIALNGASAALGISDVPFVKLVGAVRVGLVDGQYIVNPTYEDLQKSKLDVVVAGTEEMINMIEAGAKEVTEAEMEEALKVGHQHIKELIALQKELIQLAGKEKFIPELYKPNEELNGLIRKHVTDKIRKALEITDKQVQSEALDQITRDNFLLMLKEMMSEEEYNSLAEKVEQNPLDFDYVAKLIKEEQLTSMILDEGKRPDGRTLKQIRPLSAQVSVLPRTHGSGLFTRGETQVLSIITLGAIGDEQIIDGLAEEESKRYMHQYNFLPFSTGETKALRGPGRREIGHGALAEKALVPVLPEEEVFPYTIRVVSEVLESNGSTSMASVCGSTLGLMDAGVPIKAPVAGIAMGLVSRADEFKVLTDIQGVEDFFGEMDFKVAGTSEGITAVQLDTKIEGITSEMIEITFQQAKEARLFILDKVIKTTIPEPRADLSPYAPRIITFKIDPAKIKDVIGPGGKIIDQIISQTGVKIDIEQDGQVYILSTNEVLGLKARGMVENLTKEITVGEVFLGKVMRIAAFGAFVEILPGKEGLLHISKLSNRRIEKVEDVLNLGEEVLVQVDEVDRTGKISLSKKGTMAEPPPKVKFAAKKNPKRRF